MGRPIVRGDLWVTRIDRSVTVLEQISASIAVFAMVTTAVVIFGDVLLRYSVNSPLIWVHDAVSFYLMPAIFYLALARSFRDGAHVNIELLHDSVGLKLRAVFDLVSIVAAGLFFMAIGWLGAQRAFVSAREHDVMMSAVEWPTWPYLILVPIGSSLFVLHLAVAATKKVLRLVRAAPHKKAASL